MFPNKLRQLRQQHHYSMDKLAELYNQRFQGKLNKSTISRYENGLQEPMISVVKNLAELFQVSLDYLTDNPSIITPTPAESKLLIQYRALSISSQKTVEALIYTLSDLEEKKETNLIQALADIKTNQEQTATIAAFGGQKQSLSGPDQTALDHLLQNLPSDSKEK